jgi:hypothetical protein
MNFHVSPDKVQRAAGHVVKNFGNAKRQTRQSITELYAMFDAAHRAMRAIPDSESMEDTAVERAVDECSRIAWKIVKARARTLDEMLLKISIAGWCASAMRPGDTLADLEHWRPREFCHDEEHYALVSLREDIRRPQGRQVRQPKCKMDEPGRYRAIPNHHGNGSFAGLINMRAALRPRTLIGAPDPPDPPAPVEMARPDTPFRAGFRCQPTQRHGRGDHRLLRNSGRLSRSPRLRRR